MHLTGNTDVDIYNRAVEKLAFIGVGSAAANAMRQIGGTAPEEGQDVSFINRTKGMPGIIASGLRTGARTLAGGAAGAGLGALATLSAMALGGGINNYRPVLNGALVGASIGAIPANLYGLATEAFAKDPTL